MPADSAIAPPAAGGGLAAASWTFLTNPYCISALACGALAIALSYALSTTPTPRDAKRRVTAGDVRRVADAAFVFRAAGPSLPFIMLDAAARKLSALHPRPLDDAPHESPVSASAPAAASTSAFASASTPSRLSIALPMRSRPFQADQFREQLLANLDHVRVLDSGLHVAGGRGVVITSGPGELDNVLQFNSREAATMFLDVLQSAREERTKRPDKLSLFLTTFNVGNSQPPDDLTPWLGGGADADVVAIGAQECSYTPTASDSLEKDRPARSQSANEDVQYKKSSPAGFGTSEATPLLNEDNSSSDSLSRNTGSLRSAPSQPLASTATSGRDHWHALLSAHFPEDDFECVGQFSAWDRCLTVFVRKTLASAVSLVRHDTANVGLGGVAGNKGAIAARFSVYDTDFVVVNSHLAAHHKEVTRRNEDFSSIASGLYGIRDNPDVDVFSSPVHHVFWMGDLNYRINLERDRVLELIEQGDWKQLQDADQLVHERNAGRAFQGFHEGATDFRPTYRYEKGSRKYSDLKLRIPSYCDRILYRSLTGCSLELHEYKPADEIVTSDHSPVYAKFSASLLHTTGTRKLEELSAETPIQEARDRGMRSPIASPRSLSMRSLIPNGIPGFFAAPGLQLQFKSLSARGLPEMDHDGRRIAVVKALHIQNHVGWKKHENLGEGQHADPYCTFHGDVVAELDQGVYRTGTVTASQNPVWELDAIPKIDLIASGGAMSRRKYMVITVKNENSVRSDDAVGSAVLWLGGAAGGAIETKDAPEEFDLPLMLAGRQQGQVQGSYIIRKL